MKEKKLKNHYFYLGPKYTEAVHAFHDSVNNSYSETEECRAHLVRIPCDEYAQIKPEKDKKKKLASSKHSELRQKKLGFNNAERHRLEDWLIKYHEITVQYATRDYKGEDGQSLGTPPPVGYFSDVNRMNHFYKQYEEPVKNQLQGLYPADARPTAENALRGVKRWYKLSHAGLIKLRDKLYEDKRRLETNEKGVKPRIKFRRSEKGIPVFNGTYIWGGLLWDTDKLYDYCKEKGYDYYWIDQDPAVKRILQATITTLYNKAPSYRREGGNSFYCIKHQKHSYAVASDHYHDIHIKQLYELYEITGEDFFKTLSEAFALDSD